MIQLIHVNTLIKQNPKYVKNHFNFNARYIIVPNNFHQDQCRKNDEYRHQNGKPNLNE